MIYCIAQGTIHFVIIYKGTESEKEDIHIIYLNHFAVHLKLTQHCKATILQKHFLKYMVSEHPSYSILDLGEADQGICLPP